MSHGQADIEFFQNSINKYVGEPNNGENSTTMAARIQALSPAYFYFPSPEQNRDLSSVDPWGAPRFLYGLFRRVRSRKYRS